MEDIQIKSDLIEQLIGISKEAGKAILEVYNSDFDYELKEDLSPLTKADTLSHNIICERLEVLTPDIPILSEENSNIPFDVRTLWKQYWLVDPLDGTKEFIKRNGEFTVNIALIENNKPIFGVIHIPSINSTYWGSEEAGSYQIESDAHVIKLQVSKSIHRPLRIICSRSHPSKELNSFLKKIKNYQIIKVGSSIKFCLIASGKADIYPRLGPTSEWDTAAGHAIVKFAGGHIRALSEDLNLQYNLTENNLNPYFVVASRKDIALNAISLMK